MKLSVSLTVDDVAFVDEYASQAGVASRSAVIHQAIELLRNADLEVAYAEAWDEWDGGEDAALWDSATADGVTDATR